MKAILYATTLALSAVGAIVPFALSGCAATMPEPSAPDHAAHHPADAAATPAPSTDRYAAQMKTMQEMHQKMMAAKTPEERAALMQEHMKAMQGGMSMMCRMGGGMGMGMGPSTPPASPRDTTSRCMQMGDMMMQMMNDWEGVKAPPR